MQIDEIIINPYCKVNYASFYIYGIKKLFRKKADFSFRKFQNVAYSNQCITFIVLSGGQRYRFAIDYHDSRNCDEAILEWCEYYAKINLNKETFSSLRLKRGDAFLLANKMKIFSITPSFGIRCFSLLQTIRFCVQLLRGRKNHRFENIKDVLRAYIKRRSLDRYKPIKSKKNYIFFIGSIWDKSTSYINLPRASFIRACRSLSGVRFEGGFVDIGYSVDYIPDIQSLMYHENKISLTKFLQKSKQSRIVFNNPSVAHCHGWKLAEYLAMGKAVLSLPLSNELPVELQQGKNIFFVEDSQELISDAVEELLGDELFCEELESGASAYWEQVAKPEAILKYILNRGGLSI